MISLYNYHKPKYHQTVYVSQSTTRQSTQVKVPPDSLRKVTTKRQAVCKGRLGHLAQRTFELQFFHTSNLVFNYKVSLLIPSFTENKLK